MTDELTTELAAVIAEAVNTGDGTKDWVDLAAQAIAERLEQVGWWDPTNEDRELGLSAYYPGSRFNQDLADKMGWKPAFTVRLEAKP